jgi:hypothetical protein
VDSQLVGEGLAVLEPENQRNQAENKSNHDRDDRP